jgi:hypothetical protein
MDQLPLENFENSRIELLVCQKSLVVSCVKSWPLVGRMVDYRKKGGVFFEIFDRFLLEYFSLCFNKWIWLRDRKLSLMFKNKPSGGKEWSKYAKSDSKQICVLIWIDVALLLVALCCVGINHQKGGDWKGNVPFGHF